jgi:ketosteroid isomerase-like protein
MAQGHEPLSANLELVRSIFADWERGDFSRTEWAHRDIEFGGPPGGVAFSESKGLAAMARAWSDYLSMWSDVSVVADEHRELDHERVLVFSHYRGRGKLSGLNLQDIPRDQASLFHIRDGKVTKLVLYSSRDLALADLGLAPEDGCS